MRNDTLNALILRHGDRMLQDAGWPQSVSMMQIAPERMPGWLVACGSLDAGQLLALVTHLCQPLTYGRAALLTASARRLAGTPARLRLSPAKLPLAPERLADAMSLHLPFAQEWLTPAECDDLLAFLRENLDAICNIARQDAHHLAAALQPSATPRLLERSFGDWRLLADEYADDWPPATDPSHLDAVLDGVLVRGARYCPVLLTLVNEREEDIEAEGFLAHTLIIPGDPVRRWFDRATLKNMIIGVRNGLAPDD